MSARAISAILFGRFAPKDFLYIRNLRPDRWPAGDPEVYFAVGPFGDIDDGPCKREVMRWRWARRGRSTCSSCRAVNGRAEELYDLKKDPYEMVNVADKAEYAKAKAMLRGTGSVDEDDRRSARIRTAATIAGTRSTYFGKPEKKKQGKQTLWSPLLPIRFIVSRSPFLTAQETINPERGLSTSSYPRAP